MMARLFWISFLTAAAIYAVMAFWSVPILTAEADGLMMLDMRPLGYSPEEARAFLAALSDEGRVFYLTVQQRLDLVYPAVLAMSFVSAFFWALSGQMRWGLSAVAVLGALADYLENFRVAGLLRADAVSDQMVEAASLATVLKSGAVSLCFVALVVLALRAILRRR